MGASSVSHDLNQVAAKVQSGARRHANQSEMVQSGSTPLRRVLCPIDLSSHANEVLQAFIAWSFAKQTGARAQYRYINPFFENFSGFNSHFDGLSYSEQISSISEKEIILEDEEKLRTFLKKSGVPVESKKVLYECDVGSLHESFSAWFEEEEGTNAFDSLIVLNKSSSSAFMDLLSGSLASRAARISSHPTLIIPECFHLHHWLPKHLIVGDSLVDSDLVTHPFLETLRGMGAMSIELVHACRSSEESSYLRLETYFEKLGAQWGSKKLTFLPGKPEEVLIDSSRQWMDSGLLVVNRSKTAGELGYFGSTLQHLVSKTRIPILVLPHQKQEDIEQSADSQVH